MVSGLPLCRLNHTRRKLLRMGWSYEAEREDQELNNRMFCPNIESESRTQTFMFDGHPNPSWVSCVCVTIQSQWSCDETKKTLRVPSDKEGHKNLLASQELIVYVTCRHTWTKRHADIWTCVRKQQTQSNDPTKTCFRTRRSVSEMEVLFTVNHLKLKTWET